jgi:hypothetical protein
MNDRAASVARDSGLGHVYSLPPGVRISDELSDTVFPAGARLFVTGFLGDCEGTQIAGSSASDEGPPVHTAYMEFLERAYLLKSMAERERHFFARDRRGRRIGRFSCDRVFPSDSPRSYRWSKSNGVAIGESWSSAATRAERELVERDRVLRSWYGQIVPKCVAFHDTPVLREISQTYSLSAYSFGTDDATGICVVGFFAFPSGKRPLAYGFGASTNPREAGAKAVRECLQRLAFLWEEALPSCDVEMEPTPDSHQEFYLFSGNHDRIRHWLSGEHASVGSFAPPFPCAPPSIVDITPSGLGSDLVLAKALSDGGHLPLAFGTEHPMLDPNAPPFMKVHPVV